MITFESDLMPQIKKITARVVDRIRKKTPHIYFESRFEGCTQGEIEELMAIQEVTFLPPLFRDFLLHIGKKNGQVISLNGYNSIKYFKKQLSNTLLFAEVPLSVPHDAFVFRSDTVYFLFFHTQAREIDPSVYRYYDGHKDFEKVADSLSEWFQNEIDDNESFYLEEYPE